VFLLRILNKLCSAMGWPAVAVHARPAQPVFDIVAQWLEG
jgi:hypothetical protein